MNAACDVNLRHTGVGKLVSEHTGSESDAHATASSSSETKPSDELLLLQATD